MRRGFLCAVAYGNTPIAEKFDISFPSFINIRLLSLFNSGSVLPDFSFFFIQWWGGGGRGGVEVVIST